MERVINGIVAGPALINQEQCTSIILNEGDLSSKQRARLIHWRQAHRQSGEGKIQENCPICEEGKRNKKRV
jgi:hypothetical protein